VLKWHQAHALKRNIITCGFIYPYLKSDSEFTFKLQLVSEKDFLVNDRDILKPDFIFGAAVKVIYNGSLSMEKSTIALLKSRV